MSDSNTDNYLPSYAMEPDPIKDCDKSVFLIQDQQSTTQDPSHNIDVQPDCVRTIGSPLSNCTPGRRQDGEDGDSDNIEERDDEHDDERDDERDDEHDDDDVSNSALSECCQCEIKKCMCWSAAYVVEVLVTFGLIAALAIITIVYIYEESHQAQIMKLPNNKEDYYGISRGSVNTYYHQNVHLRANDYLEDGITLILTQHVPIQAIRKDFETDLFIGRIGNEFYSHSGLKYIANVTAENLESTFVLSITRKGVKDSRMHTVYTGIIAPNDSTNFTVVLKYSSNVSGYYRMDFADGSYQVSGRVTNSLTYNVISGNITAYSEHDPKCSVTNMKKECSVPVTRFHEEVILVQGSSENTAVNLKYQLSAKLVTTIGTPLAFIVSVILVVLTACICWKKRKRYSKSVQSLGMSQSESIIYTRASSIQQESGENIPLLD